MTDKKRRQADPGVQRGTSDSSEDNQGRSSSLDCEHVKKFKVRSSKSAISRDCKACSKEKVKDGEKKNSDPGTVDLFVCLCCGNVSCGENGSNHALQHSKSSPTKTDCHDFALNLTTDVVWCFQCNKEVQCKNLESRAKSIKKKFDTPGRKSGRNSLPEQEIKSPCQAMPFLNKEATNKQPLVKGLMNLGNTCFYNSVLQCLAQTPYLVPVLEKLSEEGEKFVLPEKKELDALKGELKFPDHWEQKGLTLPLLDLLKEMNGDASNIVRPEKLLSRLQERYDQFKGRDQHDAHELLRHLLEGVRIDDLERYRMAILQKFDFYGKEKEKKANRNNPEKKKIIKMYDWQANELPLGPDILFRGQLISTLECQECKSSSTRTENFLDLSLPVTEEKPMPPARKKELDLPTCPSKQQLRKEKKTAKRLEKIASKKAPPRHPDGIASNEESGLGDADVEDNVEPDTSLLDGKNDVTESGYSSEKAQNPHSESISPAESGSSYVEPPQPFMPDEDDDETIAIAVSKGSGGDGADSTAGPSKLDSGLNSCSSLPPLKLSPVTSSPPMTPVADALDTSITSVTQDCCSSDSHAMTQVSGQSGDAVAEDGIEGNAESDSQQMMPKCSPSEAECGVPAPLSLDISHLEKKLRVLSTASSGPDATRVADENENEVEDDSSKDSSEDSSKDSSEYSSKDTSKESPKESSKESSKDSKETAREAVKDMSTQPSWRRTLSTLSASEGECSVMSCLHEFTHVEIMKGANRVGCDTCTRNRGKDGDTVYTTSTKQLLISAPPAVLILHLKRFIAETFRLKKMNRHVTFPFSLNLAPFCSVKCRELPSITADQSDILYSLYGIVEHSGQMYGGHYVAYVKVRQSLGDQDPRWQFLAPGRPFLQTRPSPKDPPSETTNIKSTEEKWYHISDSRVSLVDEERVRRSQAYLLFYERVV